MPQHRKLADLYHRVRLLDIGEEGLEAWMPSGNVTWVEPTFSAEVEFRDITSEGLLRQSSFKGLKKGST